MENKDLIIIALLGLTIYLYYQNNKLRKLPVERILVAPDSSASQTLFEIQDEQSLLAFDKDKEEEKENLIADKDEAIRKKNEVEAEALDLGNKLKLKQQEVNSKEQEINRLKQEKDRTEIALNEKIKELKNSKSMPGN
jgi:transcriptional regulator of acetoin/glycerol metabolism